MKHHPLPSLQVGERWASNLLLAWQESSELQQLLSQLSCAGERSGRGETLPAGTEEGSRCVIPFCSLDGRDHRAYTGHEVSSAPLKSHIPLRITNPCTHAWQTTLAAGTQPSESLLTQYCVALVANKVRGVPGCSRKPLLLMPVRWLPRGHGAPSA